MICPLYSQQQEMYCTNTHRVENRIVSLSQPRVRPIVRGKQNAEVEFRAKVEMSDVNGYLRVEDLRWDAFNESTPFQESVENYRIAIASNISPYYTTCMFGFIFQNCGYNYEFCFFQEGSYEKYTSIISINTTISRNMHVL